MLGIARHPAAAIEIIKRFTKRIAVLVSAIPIVPIPIALIAHAKTLMRHFNQRTPEDTDLAEPLFEKVVALDSSFALAYAMHAWLLHNAVAYGFRSDRKEQLQIGIELGRTSVRLDDRDAVGHFALGRVLALSSHR